MKYLFLLILFSPMIVRGQNDTSTFRAYDKTFNTFSKPHKNVNVVQEKEVMILVGDSLYNTLDSFQLNKKLDSGLYSVDVINNRDSIEKILMSRIKGVIILRRK